MSKKKPLLRDLEYLEIEQEEDEYRVRNTKTGEVPVTLQKEEFMFVLLSHVVKKSLRKINEIMTEGGA